MKPARKKQVAMLQKNVKKIFGIFEDNLSPIEASQVLLTSLSMVAAIGIEEEDPAVVDTIYTGAEVLREFIRQELDLVPPTSAHEIH